MSETGPVNRAEPLEILAEWEGPAILSRVSCSRRRVPRFLG